MTWVPDTIPEDHFNYRILQTLEYLDLIAMRHVTSITSPQRAAVKLAHCVLSRQVPAEFFCRSPRTEMSDPPQPTTV